MNLCTLANGETYTDNSLRSDCGSIFYTKTDEGMFSPGFSMNLFNPATGKEEFRNIPGLELSYTNTDWTAQHNIMLSRLQEIKQLSNTTKDNYKQMNAMYSPEEIMAWYEKETGANFSK